MEAKGRDTITIVMADDDPDDCKLAQDAFDEARLSNRLLFVKDGVELLELLRRQGRFASERDEPLPSLILLDLNMPRMDGRETLEHIKADRALCHIPVVVLTTSRAEEDVMRTYQLGANSYIVKPVTFESLVEVVQQLGRYWFQLVEMPSAEANG
jgi:CheY-like chemotaxis protein